MSNASDRPQVGAGAAGPPREAGEQPQGRQPVRISSPRASGRTNRTTREHGRRGEDGSAADENADTRSRGVGGTRPASPSRAIRRRLQQPRRASDRRSSARPSASSMRHGDDVQPPQRDHHAELAAMDGVDRRDTEPRREDAVERRRCATALDVARGSSRGSRIPSALRARARPGCRYPRAGRVRTRPSPLLRAERSLDRGRAFGDDDDREVASARRPHA